MWRNPHSFCFCVIIYFLNKFFFKLSQGEYKIATDETWTKLPRETSVKLMAR